jgi:hypothetical protein
MNSAALSLDAAKGTATPARKSSRTQVSRSTRKSHPLNGDIATKRPDQKADATEPKF